MLKAFQEGPYTPERMKTLKAVSVLETKTLSELAEIYNSQVDKGEEVKRFSDKSSAIKRILALEEKSPFLLQKKDVTSKSSERKKGNTKMTNDDQSKSTSSESNDSISASSESPKKKSGGGKVGRTSQYEGKKIYKLKDENPRRPGTHGHKSFSIIRNGMRYETYIEAGGRRKDLDWDIAKGNVEIREE